MEFLRKENFPGEFPYTAGVFPLKRAGEDPRRQFAGERTPERTNERFHVLSRHDTAKRLSTAFDSVTLYGEDPDERPDIYGKVGESGVSVCTLEDMKKLYDGFDLCDPATSVSMTINGPAPTILAFYMNTAIDQRVTKVRRNGKRKRLLLIAKKFGKKRSNSSEALFKQIFLKKIKPRTLAYFRQNFRSSSWGIFKSILFKTMSKIIIPWQSISGYHIAEAGANPGFRNVKLLRWLTALRTSANII